MQNEKDIQLLQLIYAAVLADAADQFAVREALRLMDSSAAGSNGRSGCLPQ